MAAYHWEARRRQMRLERRLRLLQQVGPEGGAGGGLPGEEAPEEGRDRERSPWRRPAAGSPHRGQSQGIASSLPEASPAGCSRMLLYMQYSPRPTAQWQTVEKILKH